MCDPTAEKLSIGDLLTRFFQAFDDKNWSMVRDCLCDELFTDYSSFRGEPPAIISGDWYVEQRRNALQELDMRHNFLNLRIELDAAIETATARCNYIILRFHSSFDGINERYFHSSGHYVFGFARVSGAWRISSITQQLSRNHGDREIHGATRTQAPIKQAGLAES